MKQLGLPQSTGFIATLLGGILLTVGAPLAGHWSDRVGRVRLMLAVTALFFISAWPSFLLLTTHPSLGTIILVVCWLSLLKTAYSGSLPALMAELFPTRTRSTGMSLSYNTAVPLFGGFAPLIVASLIELTGQSTAPSFYLMGTAVLSFGVLILVRRRLGMA